MKNPIGTYTSQGVLKTKRHNKTYKKVPTKRIKERNAKLAVRILLVWCIFTTSYAMAMTSNKFVISCDEVVQATSIATPERAEVETPLPEQVNAVMVETKEQENERKIRELAKEFNFKWTDWLIRLAVCESSLNEKISNSKGNTPAGSIDRGIFQINNYWHSEVSDECSYDLRCSTIWTMQRVNAGYQKEWSCDRLIKR